jgi:hypothetical protein
MFRTNPRHHAAGGLFSRSPLEYCRGGIRRELARALSFQLELAIRQGQVPGMYLVPIRPIKEHKAICCAIVHSFFRAEGRGFSGEVLEDQENS